MDYERIKRLYVDEGRLTPAGLEKAVKNGWITEGQKDELIRLKYEKDSH